MEKEIITWLKKEQDKLQKKFKKKITNQRKGIYDFRGVWITVTCTCNYSFTTPYYIPHNGKCQKCGKLFCRVLKKELHPLK